MPDSVRTPLGKATWPKFAVCQDPGCSPALEDHDPFLDPKIQRRAQRVVLDPKEFGDSPEITIVRFYEHDVKLISYDGRGGHCVFGIQCPEGPHKIMIREEYLPVALMTQLLKAANKKLPDWLK